MNAGGCPQRGVHVGLCNRQGRSGRRVSAICCVAVVACQDCFQRCSGCGTLIILNLSLKLTYKCENGLVACWIGFCDDSWSSTQSGVNICIRSQISTIVVYCNCDCWNGRSNWISADVTIH